jgi:hypothetical protein
MDHHGSQQRMYPQGVVAAEPCPAPGSCWYCCAVLVPLCPAQQPSCFVGGSGQAAAAVATDSSEITSVYCLGSSCPAGQDPCRGHWWHQISLLASGLVLLLEEAGGSLTFWQGAAPAGGWTPVRQVALPPQPVPLSLLGCFLRLGPSAAGRDSIPGMQ